MQKQAPSRAEPSETTSCSKGSCDPGLGKQIVGTDDHLVDRLAHFTARLVRRLRVLERREVSCCGVPFAQSMVLQVLHREKRQRMSRLADEVGVAQSTATRLVEPLVKEGLVERSPASDDRRAVEVGLTTGGREMADQLADGSRRCCEGMLERIPEGKRDQVIESLELLTRAADECCSET